MRLLVAEVAAANTDTLRQVGDELRNALGPSVIVLGSNIGGRPSFVVMTREAGGRAHAGNLIKAVASAAGGNGGGRPDMAQGGGTDPAKLAEALALGRRLAREQIAERV